MSEFNLETRDWSKQIQELPMDNPPDDPLIDCLAAAAWDASSYFWAMHGGSMQGYEWSCIPDEVKERVQNKMRFIVRAVLFAKGEVD